MDAASRGRLSIGIAPKLSRRILLACPRREMRLLAVQASSQSEFTMLPFGGWRVLTFPSRTCLHGIHTRRSLATKAYEPLRILFCGSDEFSIVSLRALHEEQLRCSDRIASIDVVCRPGKRVGRGLKQIREGTFTRSHQFDPQGSRC